MRWYWQMMVVAALGVIGWALWEMTSPVSIPYTTCPMTGAVVTPDEFLIPPTAVPWGP